MDTLMCKAIRSTARAMSTMSSERATTMCMVNAERQTLTGAFLLTLAMATYPRHTRPLRPEIVIETKHPTVLCAHAPILYIQTSAQATLHHRCVRRAQRSSCY